MKNFYLFLILFISFINIIKCDLTLYVNPSFNGPIKECGNTIQSPCTTIVAALQSYVLQTDGTNKTTLNLQLLDGTYQANANSILLDNIYLTTLNIQGYTKNTANVVLTGSTSGYPFLNYLQASTIDYTLSISYVTFENSYSIINSTSTLSVTFNYCVFRDVPNGLNSLLYLTNPDRTFNPALVIYNTQFSNIKTPALKIVESLATTFILKNITVSNCVGSTLFDFSGSGTFINVSTSGNTASISSFGFTLVNGLNIYGGTFDGNSGPSLTFFNADTYTLLIQGANFTNNKAPQQNGGAISFNSNTGGSSKVNNCNFISNSAVNGGAIYSTDNSLTIQSSTFKFNSASAGGAFYADEFTSVTLTGCTISNNNAANGGAIYAYQSTVSLDSDTLISNTAQQGNDVSCSQSTMGINSPLTPSNYWCAKNDCKFTTPSNFQCPSSPTSSSASSASTTSSGSTTTGSNTSGGSSSTTSSTTGGGDNGSSGNTIITTSSSSITGFSTTTGTSPNKGLDNGEKVGIAIGVSIAGFIVITVGLCAIIRYNRRRHHYSSSHYGSSASIHTSTISPISISTHHESSPLIDHHHHHHHDHHGHHGHHGNHGHHGHH